MATLEGAPKARKMRSKFNLAIVHTITFLNTNNVWIDKVAGAIN
jgi:hypothetical protein